MKEASSPEVRGRRALLLVLLTLGFALRFWNAAYRFLNADEALHYLLSVQSSLTAAYRASFTTVHPPLLIIFLHYWGMLGRSELFLRLPSVIAGAKTPEQAKMNAGAGGWKFTKAELAEVDEIVLQSAPTGAAG